VDKAELIHKKIQKLPHLAKLRIKQIQFFYAKKPISEELKQISTARSVQASSIHKICSGKLATYTLAAKLSDSN